MKLSGLFTAAFSVIAFAVLTLSHSDQSDGEYPPSRDFYPPSNVNSGGQYWRQRHWHQSQQSGPRHLHRPPSTTHWPIPGPGDVRCDARLSRRTLSLGPRSLQPRENMQDQAGCVRRLPRSISTQCPHEHQNHRIRFPRRRKTRSPPRPHCQVLRKLHGQLLEQLRCHHMGFR